jgi:hypothetical protein
VVFNALSHLPWDKQVVIMLSAIPKGIDALDVAPVPSVLKVTNAGEVSVFCKTSDLKGYVERTRKQKK